MNLYGYADRKKEGWVISVAECKGPGMLNLIRWRPELETGETDLKKAKKMCREKMGLVGRRITWIVTDRQTEVEVRDGVSVMLTDRQKDYLLLMGDIFRDLLGIDRVLEKGACIPLDETFWAEVEKRTGRDYLEIESWELDELRSYPVMIHQVSDSVRMTYAGWNVYKNLKKGEKA